MPTLQDFGLDKGLVPNQRSIRAADTVANAGRTATNDAANAAGLANLQNQQAALSEAIAKGTDAQGNPYNSSLLATMQSDLLGSQIRTGTYGGGAGVYAGDQSDVEAARNLLANRDVATPAITATTPRGQELQKNAAARGEARQSAQLQTPQPIDLASIDAKYKAVTDAGGSIDPAKVLDEKTAAMKYNAVIQESQQKEDEAAKLQAESTAKRGAASAASAAESAGATRKAQTGSAFDALIASSPPEMQGYLQSAKAYADSLGAEEEEMTYDEFGNLQSTKAMEKPFDAVQKILDDHAAFVKGSVEKQQTFMDEQLDRTTKFNAQSQENILNQLTWQQSKLERDQTDFNKKELDRMTVSLALRGGYGSDDGNREVAEARRKGEETIMDLQKEFGFKKTDTMLAFTQLTNKAYDDYKLGWLESQDKLKANISSISMQGIANQQAKGNAISSAYREYVKDIKDRRVEYAKTLMDAQKVMVTEINAKRDDERAQSIADKRLVYQEEQANQRMQMTLDNQARLQMNADRKIETASADDIRSQIANAKQQKDVQIYIELRSARDRAKAAMEDAIASKDPTKLGAAKVNATVLAAKGADPMTGVRDGEFQRMGRAQTWINRVDQAGRAIEGGDLTGLSTEVVNAYVEAMDIMTEAQKTNALSQFIAPLNATITHNNRAEFFPLNPSDVLPPEFLDFASTALQSFYTSQERIDKSTSYDVDWSEFSAKGGGESQTVIGDEITSLGPVTQGFSTPAIAKGEGGLYDEATVRAWGGIHAGTDIAVQQGTPLTSFVDGEVVEIGNEKGWGGTIVIKDSLGAEHRISHLSAVNGRLKKGDMITRGTVLAKSGGARGAGGSGNSTGAHVDYRIRKDGKYVDPLTYSNS